MSAASEVIRTKPPARAKSGAVFVYFAAAMAVCTRWIAHGMASLPTTWAHDFRYFWQSGRCWLDGISPYAAACVEEGARNFPAYANPFFYPPNIFPFLAPLALTPPMAAAYTFYALNGLLTVLIALSVSTIAKKVNPALAIKYFPILVLIFLVAYMRPFVTVASYGQITILFAGAFVLLLWAITSQSQSKAIMALTILAIKPAFGIAGLAFALANPKLRKAAVIAIGISVGLTVLGLVIIGPLEAIPQFLHNLSLYSTISGNFAANSGGVPFISHLLHLDSPIWLTILMIGAPAAALGFAARSPEASMIGLLFAITLSLFVAPNHTTDFVLLAPVIIAIFAPTRAMPRVAAGLALLILGRVWDIAYLFNTPLAVGYVVGILKTVAFVVLLISLYTIFTELNRNKKHSTRSYMTSGL